MHLTLIVDPDKRANFKFNYSELCLVLFSLPHLLHAGPFGDSGDYIILSFQHAFELETHFKLKFGDEEGVLVTKNCFVVEVIFKQ